LAGGSTSTGRDCALPLALPLVLVLVLELVLPLLVDFSGASPPFTNCAEGAGGEGLRADFTGASPPFSKTVLPLAEPEPDAEPVAEPDADPEAEAEPEEVEEERMVGRTGARAEGLTGASPSLANCWRGCAWACACALRATGASGADADADSVSLSFWTCARAMGDLARADARGLVGASPSVCAPGTARGTRFTGAFDRGRGSSSSNRRRSPPSVASSRARAPFAPMDPGPAPPGDPLPIDPLPIDRLAPILAF
jgi:hypothetical protein